MKEKISFWLGLIFSFSLISAGGLIFFLNYKFFQKILEAMQYGLGYPILISGLVLLCAWVGLWYISSEDENEKDSN